MNKIITTSNEFKVQENCETFYVNFDKEAKYLTYKNAISNILSNFVGIVRNHDDLLNGKKKLKLIGDEEKLESDEYFSNRLFSLISVAELIINGAIERVESRGVHRRSDNKERSKIPYNVVQTKFNEIKKDYFNETNT